MKIIFRFLVGAINALMLLSIFVNAEFWKTWGYIMHVAGARNVENFSAFFTQLFSYITFAMVVGYCFNHALRNREKFWNAVFVMNCIGLLVVFVLILAVRFATSYQNGAGGVMLVFVPLGMIFAVNVAMLLASAKKNMNEETELQNDA